MADYIFNKSRLSKAQLKFIRSLVQKKCRDESGMFVAEGRKCVEELAKTFPLVCLVSLEKIELSLPLSAYAAGDVPYYTATSTEIAQMSSLRAPQGVLAVFRKPGLQQNDSAEEQPLASLVLALDGVQDPGNLGTIIRTCDWFGVHDIYCSPDTADCYNPKVVQATMGALARVRVHYVSLEQRLSAWRAQGVPVYGTLLDGRNMYAEGAIPDAKRGVIVMGNEGNGISASVRALVSHPLLIPSYPPDAETSESLNVSIATAIVLAAFRRG
ncbi:MAG: TrmH family RNA methyltransferase [Paludibacteraceae bacterium]